MFACLLHENAESSADLARFAREWAPRVETIRAGMVVLEASGLTRLFGGPDVWARRLTDAARDRGWPVRLAVAGTRMAAVLLALGRTGITVVQPGDEAAAVASLPLTLLQDIDVFGLDGSKETSRPASLPARHPSGTNVSAQPPAEKPQLRTSRGRRPVSGSARHYRMAPGPDQASGFGLPASGTERASGVGPQASRKECEAGRRKRAAAEALVETLQRWGLSTLGELAGLPAADIAARLGADGRRWQERARGSDPQPFSDDRELRRFEATLDLDWPIDALEPLSFVLTRLLEPLCADLHREERGAARVRTRLDLITRTAHLRTLELPAPMNDPKVLRTLILLDLEAHPPGAAIDRVTIQLEPMPGRRVQFSLFRRPLPAPDQVATLMARLNALMGEGRSGSPRLLDTHRPGAFAMDPFVPRERQRSSRRGRKPPKPVEDESPTGVSEAIPDDISEPRDGGQPRAVLRRFRRPLEAKVTVHDGRPVRIATDGTGLSGGVIATAAGPWRSSGAWWARAWSRDEWDVALRHGPVYRVSRRRSNDRWSIEGIWD